MRLSNFYRSGPTRVKRHDLSIKVIGRRLYDGHGVTVTAERTDGALVQVTLSADELSQLSDAANGSNGGSNV